MNYRKFTENLLKENGFQIEKIMKSTPKDLTICINGKYFYADNWGCMYYFFLGYFSKRII